MLSSRLTRRLLWHHLPLAIGTGVSLATFYAFVDSENPVFRWSMASAFVGLGLIVITLAVGPLNVLRRRPNPVSTDVRRDIGIWAALVSVAHFVLGLQLHMKSRWQYFVTEVTGPDAWTLRADFFGFANYTGLAATILAVVLLALSNDWALRRMGTGRWKAWQRWNYALFVIVLVHGVAYQIIEKRQAAYVVLMAIMAMIAIALQVAGRRRRGADRPDQPAHSARTASAETAHRPE